MVVMASAKRTHNTGYVAASVITKTVLKEGLDQSQTVVTCTASAFGKRNGLSTNLAVASARKRSRGDVASESVASFIGRFSPERRARLLSDRKL
jgi:hypothetical protein